MVRSTKNISLFFTFVLFLALFFLNDFLPKAHADTLDFDVSPVGKTYYNLGYFKFNAKTNETIDIPVKITNLSKQAMQVDIRKLNALTSPYGNIQYVPSQKLLHSKLIDQKRGMAQYLSGINAINLRAGEQQVIHFTLKTPSSVNSGTILGGLSFKKHQIQVQNKNIEQKNKGIIINNEFERVVGIEADYSKPNVLPVAASGVGVEATASSPNVLVSIRNSNPIIVNNIHFDYNLMQGNKSLFKGKTNAFKMAPSSEISYPITWTYKTFEAGNYKLHLTLYENGKKIEKTFNVIVPEQTVKDYQKLIRPVAKTSNTWMYLLGGLVIILIGIIIFLLWKRKKDKDGEEDNEENSKSV